MLCHWRSCRMRIVSITCVSVALLLPVYFISQFQGTMANIECPHTGLLGSRADLGGEACPPHPGFMHGMCIRCGQEADGEDASDVALR